MRSTFGTGPDQAIFRQVAIGRAERFDLLRPRVVELFGEKRSRSVFELLELVEMAYHDCFGEVSPPSQVIEDLLTCSDGDWEKLIHASNLAVIDFRDLRLWALDLQKSG